MSKHASTSSKRSLSARRLPWDVALLVVFVVFWTTTALVRSLSSPVLAGEMPGWSEITAATRSDKLHLPRIAGVLALPSALPDRQLRVPILMYHHIGPLPGGSDAIRRDLTVSPEEFTTQLDWLKAQGYHSIHLTDLFEALDYGAPLPPKPVVFTFDDGYQDNYDYARPLLERYGYTGTFFVIADFVGRTNYLADDYMGWSELRQARAEGFEIGSHSLDHKDLKTEARGALLDQELVASRQIIEQGIGAPVYFLCYPSGKYDDTTLQRTQAAGYLMATTVSFGTHEVASHQWELPRVRVHGGEQMKDYIENIQAP